MTPIELGRLGIWTLELERQPARRAWQAARELEELGYRSLWIPESRWREVFSNAASLLAATHRITIATGIANIYAREPVTMAAGQKTLSEAFPRRFLLGLGVGHKEAVETIHHRSYGPPVATMKAYLDAMDQAPYAAPQPRYKPPRILAAIGPRMLKLAAERSIGAHPYNTTPLHTRIARAELGDGPVLAPEQAVVLISDAGRARRVGRRLVEGSLARENYRTSLGRLGFTEADFESGGSDRLIDAIVAWGEARDVLDRVKEHLDAGADHVAIQVVPEDPGTLPMREWRVLANAMFD